MKRYISTAFKRYNANRNQENTTDCVVRAISLAFGDDYSDTRNQLNKLKRDLHQDTYKRAVVYENYLRTYKQISLSDIITLEKDDPSISVSEFCEENPEGIFLLLVGDFKGDTSHLVCIIDGDIYDSFDCSDYKVTRIYKVSSSSGSVVTFDSDEIADRIAKSAEEYLQKQQVMMPYCTLNLVNYINRKQYDKHPDENLGLAFQYQISLKFDEDLEKFELPEAITGGEDVHTFVVTLSPRLSAEDNFQRYSKQLNTQIRDWLWAYKKLLKDYQAIMKIKVNPQFKGDVRNLLLLPEWTRDKVTYFLKDDRSYLRYQVEMTPLEGDPRKTSAGDVTFVADTIKEINQQINEYKKNFSRYSYDY